MAATKSAAIGTGIGRGAARRAWTIERIVGGLLARTAPISDEERDHIAWTEAARLENRRFVTQSLDSRLVSDRLVRPS